MIKDVVFFQLYVVSCYHGYDRGEYMTSHAKLEFLYTCYPGMRDLYLKVAYTISCKAKLAITKRTTLLAMFQAQPSSTGRHHLKLVTALPCRRQVQMEILLRIESVYFGQ